MLKDLDIKSNYNSDDDNLLNEFLIPILTESYCYDRAVGYFSSQVFKIAAEGISTFIQNKGRMRLIIGTFTSIDDYDALIRGQDKDEIIKKYGDNFINDFDKFNEDLLIKFRIDCLSWLMASGQLEVKVAYRKNGIFHAKFGILKDKNENKIAFNTSGNDSRNAFEEGYNYEELSAFRSWDHGQIESVSYHTNKFEELWNNNSSNTYVDDLSPNMRNYLAQRANGLNKDELTLEKEIDLNNLENNHNVKKRGPSQPTKINGHDFEIKEHQRSALNNWQNNEFKGIFALATGTGKTITSIYGATKLYMERKSLCLIIIVPRISLADQWFDELIKFNITAIKCYEGYSRWESKLSDSINKFETKTLDFFCAVVVNNTLATERFQNLIELISKDKMMVIGDECHHHGSKIFNESLPKNAKYRIGLSATPDHYINEENNDRLKSYYGEVVETFSLEEAISKKILCPYDYNVIPVKLTPDEQDSYRELSREIGQLMSYTNNTENSQLGNLLARRSRLLANAENKLPALRNMIEIMQPQPFSLFYCGEGETVEELFYDGEFIVETSRQIDQLSLLLEEKNWKTSKFTNTENRWERKLILENFKSSSIDALVAMKCLDEGIDIPLCKTAFILASSNNNRQWVQRRGRILRKHRDKEKAIIYDFVIIPEIFNENNKHDRKLVENEILRVKEFRKSSLNPDDSYQILSPVLNRYDIEELI